MSTVESVLKENLSWLMYNEVLEETEKQEKGRWELYRGLECYTVGLAMCYLFNFKASEKGEGYWNGVCAVYRQKY